MPFAQATYFAQPPSGERSPFAVSISAPTPDPRGDFSCSVQLGDEGPNAIFGIDPLQALALAYRYLQAELERYEEQGWQFFFSETDTEPFDLLNTLCPGARPWPWAVRLTRAVC